MVHVGRLLIATAPAPALSNDELDEVRGSYLQGRALPRRTYRRTLQAARFSGRLGEGFDVSRSSRHLLPIRLLALLSGALFIHLGFGFLHRLSASSRR